MHEAENQIERLSM